MVISFLLDIVKFIAAGLAVFFIAWTVIKSYLAHGGDSGLLELKKNAHGHIFPLRLQAYERVVLFLERINPASLLPRLHVSGMNAKEMQNLILADIRAEYQHNITQQLYVSNGVWTVVQQIKEDTIKLINDAMRSLPENASGIELSKAILTHLATLESKNPYDAALTIVKQDIQRLF